MEKKEMNQRRVSTAPGYQPVSSTLSPQLPLHGIKLVYWKYRLYLNGILNTLRYGESFSWTSFSSCNDALPIYSSH
jgi:hypothetical protein